jgi:tRNA pseudouridine38-40 synthase
MLPENPRYKYGILLKVAYDGSRYSGLAIQDNAHTIAGALRRAILTLAPGSSSLRVCSRTDAGVHARGQYVAFDTDQFIPNRGWVLGLSSLLPRDVTVLSAACVPPAFSPSSHSIAKTYSYWVLQGTLRDPFLESRSWRILEQLDHSRMRHEAEDLLGTHDFRAFRGSADFRTKTVRTLSKVEIVAHPAPSRVIQLSIVGNAFMYHMMRIITGTLVDIGRGRCAPGAIRRAIASGNRLDLGMTAPAEGLYLDLIQLDDHGSQQWPEPEGAEAVANTTQSSAPTAESRPRALASSPSAPAE